MKSSLLSRRKVLVLIGLAIILLTNVVATYYFFTAPYPGANDFASRWAGARAFWRDGVSPYSDEATRQIQMLIYGRRIPPEEEQTFDPGPFAYPFYTVFTLWPIVWLPYPWAEAIWLVILQVSLFAGVLLAARIYDWRPPRWLLTFTIVWAFLFYPSARALMLGQYAIFIFALIAGCLWAWQGKKDILAGLCLALATIKPQMVFLMIPLLLVWAALARRWRFVASFAGGMALLVGASWILEPAWMASFWRQVARYPSYTAIGSPIWIIAHWALPFLGAWGEWLLSGAAVVLLVGSAWWAWGRKGRWFDWAIGMCLIVTNLVAVRTATTNYVGLLLPLVMIFRRLQRGRGGAWWVLLGEMGLLIGLWGLFLTTVVDKFEHPVVYLPLPFGLLVVFFLFPRWVVGER